jgi:hypothetical protein
MGRLCYPTRAPGRSWYFSQKIVTVQGGYGTCFCSPDTNFIAFWRGRGTSWLGTLLSRGAEILIEGSGAAVAVQIVSEPVIYHGAGFQLRADERIRVQEHYEFVSKAGVKAKTVTNNLPILSVL